MSFDLSNYQVGDEFEGSPWELGQVISAILAENGTFKYEGNLVAITSLPNRQVTKTIEAVEVVLEPVVEEQLNTWEDDGGAPEPAPVAEVKPKAVRTPRKKAETKAPETAA